METFTSKGFTTGTPVENLFGDTTGTISPTVTPANSVDIDFDLGDIIIK